MLLGEYSVMLGSDALAMPLNLFNGQLSFPQAHGSNQNSLHSNKELKALLNFLKKMQQQQKLVGLDLESFEFDLNQGLYFNSTIPQGYGVGSSAAVSASVLKSYADCELKLKLSDYSLLKNILSLIESHFHGSSSGFDPLVSYLDTALVLSQKNGIIPTILDKKSDVNQYSVFLIDSAQTRRTGALVSLFYEKYKNPAFNSFCHENLVPLTNRAIEYFQADNYCEFYQAIADLSAVQFEHFLPMIPSLLVDLWLAGLNDKYFYLKLCGAGGGGFILGMSKDIKRFKLEHPEIDFRVLFRF